jgi:alkanesulfonate monooxygenase SsuD/methylene tetrahydromethanopterin reductase-like flavin-dependent oxidoreductase (luciferase family)
MKLGLHLGYWNRNPYPGIEIAKEAENLGYDSIWTAEAYGSDCVSPLAWLGSHTSKIKLGTSVMQISARTPTCAAMTALTMDHLSNAAFNSASAFPAHKWWKVGTAKVSKNRWSAPKSG